MKKSFGSGIAILMILVFTEPMLAASSKVANGLETRQLVGKRQDASNDRAISSRIKSVQKSRVGQSRKKRVEGLTFPRGKLLASIVLVLLSIVFFALAGVTVLGILFNALGSVAIIAALVFFIFWLNEKSKEAKASAPN